MARTGRGTISLMVMTPSKFNTKRELWKSLSYVGIWNKKKCNYLLKRIRLKIRSGDVRFQFKGAIMYDGQTLKGLYEFNSGDPELITINVKIAGDNPIPTVIHEVLHSLYSDYPERLICIIEKKVFKQLSGRQIQNLLKLVMENT